MLYDCVYTVSAFTYLLVYNWVLGSKNLEHSSKIWRWGVLHSKTINESWKRIEWDFWFYTLNKPTTISLSLNTQHPRASVSFQSVPTSSEE